MDDGKEVPETARFIARCTESVDASGIASLVQRRTETVFGRINVEYIIERANLGISLVGTDNGDILAHVSLLDHPTTSSGVNSAQWEQWTRETFTCDIRPTPINTLFLHLFVAKEGFQQAAIAEVLRITFVAVPLLQYIIITAPSTTSLGPVLETHFTACPVVEGSSPSHVAHVTHRHQHFPQLHTRVARVEDADDLMAIFREHAHDMTGDYGDYFLAELIESQDSDHKTLVAKVGGHAVGFISVTTQMDLSLLNSCFQLEPYNSLRHPAPLSQDLMTESVVSIPASDHSQVSSSTSVAEETAVEPAVDSTVKDKVATESQSKLKSTSSLARLAQIAQMTSSKSRLTQSKSKLITHSTQSKTTVDTSKTTVDTSKTKPTESKTTVATSKTKSTESKTTVATSKTKSTESKSNLVSSNAQVKDEMTSADKSTGQSAVAASEPGAEAGLTSSEIEQSQMKEGQEEKTEQSTQTAKSDGGEKSRAQRLAGQSSAVAVQLFAIKDQYEMRSIDLLVAVFQAFPDHDFCLMSLPHTVPEFSLLSHFTKVPPRVHCTLPQELYIMHKCSLLHSFMVRPALTSDLSGVKHLVGSVEGSDCVMSDVVRGVEGGRDGVKEGATPLNAMVAECAGQIVGVAIIRREEELLYLQSHYNIEDFVYLSHHRPEEHGRLYHLILSPAFSPLTKHFMTEALRQSHMTSFYYPFHPSLLPLAHPHKPHTLTTALAHMVPVRYRRQVIYPSSEVLGVNQPLPAVLQETHDPFTLYHFNKKLSLEPKSVVNSRVVVVGGSDTALSLLDTLVFCPHLAFNNLILVSPAGLPRPSLPRHCWPAPLSQMGLTAWLHTVRGSVVGINREDKEVVVRSEGGGESGEDGEDGEESVVPYDHLVLCTGLQFSLPELISDHDGETPLIYDSNEGLGVSEWAQKYLQTQAVILVYGSSLEAHTAVQDLLTGGVAPGLITFIRPHPPTCFNNQIVEQRVQRSLEETGVVLLTDHTLSGVKEGGACLVTEEGEEEAVFVTCQAVICMDERQVNPHIFTALNEACLVFDRRLVTDSHYQTNDPAIMAAGPITKFSRQFHTDQWTPANFDSKEVGQKVAAVLLSRLDPTQQEPDVTSDPDLIPTYTHPKSVYTLLPGGIHYLHVEKPNLSEPLDDLMNQPTYGQELVTDTENGYFRLHINQYNRVQTITVLSEKVFETANYLCLYNLHERYLNNMSSRYSEGLISDFFLYFREPWACAMFHDRFLDLQDEILELLSQHPVVGVVHCDCVSVCVPCAG